MADALARRKTGEKSAVDNLSSAQLYGFLEEYVEADNRVKQANSARKELRDRIKVALVDADLIDAFDRFRKNRDVSGEYRAKQDAAYATMMAWDRKPLGYQAGMEIGEGGKRLPLTTADAAKIDLEGLEAGKSKLNRTDNPYNPGDEEYQRWDTAWLRGQAMIGASLTDDAEKKRETLRVVEGGTAPAAPPPAADPAAEAPAPKRRGRPPGPGKAAKAAAAAAAAGGAPNPPPDQGEGGDTGEPAPQGDPPPDAPDAPQDRYGQEWPSSGGNGTAPLQH